MRRRAFLGLAAAAATGLVAASCGRRGDEPRPVPPPPSTATLAVGKADDPAGLDPADLTDLESLQVAAPLFDTLVRFRPDSLEVEPGLAESWTSSADGRAWEFVLRPGVLFHDGTPCDAEAVAFNLARQYDPESPHRFGAALAYWGIMWGSPSRIVEARARDARRVAVRLSEPVAPFLDNLALPYFAISSPTALLRWRDQYFKHPVGTGPFRFVEWVPRERVVLEANPAWWGGRPGLERVVFRPIPDSMSRQLQLLAGDVQLVTQVLLEEVEGLQRDPRVRVATAPGMNVGFLAMNNAREPFTDVLVRRAVCHALDGPALVDGLYRGLATPASSPVPPPVWGRRDAPPPAYDPALARSLLAQAGFPDGFEAGLQYMSVARPYMPEPRAIAEAVQAMLLEVGIRTELSTSDWSQYLDSTARGEYDLCFLGWVGDSGDPDNYLSPLFASANIDTEIGGSNLFMYRNPRVDELLARASRVLERDRRAPLYLQVQRILEEDAPWAPLAYAEQVAAHHPALEGLRLHPTGLLQLQPVRWGR